MLSTKKRRRRKIWKWCLLVGALLAVRWMLYAILDGVTAPRGGAAAAAGLRWLNHGSSHVRDILGTTVYVLVWEKYNNFGYVK